MVGGLWVVSVCFRPHYCYCYRLSKWSCFVSVAIIFLVVIVIVYGYFQRSSYRIISSFGVHPYHKILLVLLLYTVSSSSVVVTIYKYV